MVGADSIRDVIAFPKITQGKDPLSASPAYVSQADLDYYHIRLNADALKDSQNDTSDTNTV
uniref:Aspartyl-tRNA synthetase n=2 Tax=Arion vulgaris TaxID=1028688 RepID=A0A0B7B9B1_9EUPU